VKRQHSISVGTQGGLTPSEAVQELLRAADPSTNRPGDPNLQDAIAKLLELLGLHRPTDLATLREREGDVAVREKAVAELSRRWRKECGE
jgi:hypothetical protein